MNHAKKIAEMLGLEIGEKFQIEDHPDLGTFWFIEDNNDGMRDLWDGNGYLNSEYCSYDSDNDILEQLLAGHFKVKKLPWKPKKGETYYRFNSHYGGTFHGYIMRCDYRRNPDVFSGQWDDNLYDLMNWTCGNCFKTEEEAIKFGHALYEKLKKKYENE